MASFQNVPLPKDWSKDTKTAFLCAVSLAHRAMVVANSWCVNSRIARVRLVAENEQLKARVAVLEEQMRIKDARMAQIPAESRPHYPPTERLAILTLKASHGWNNDRTGREFLVTADTIARWLKRLNDEGEAALVALPLPINRYPDFVTLLVRQLKSSCPLMGKQRIADTLARAGLHLSASSVGRMLKKNLTKPTRTDGNPSKPDTSNAADATAPPSAKDTAKNSPKEKPRRVVTAKHPGHVWHTDLTAVPTLLGFWIPWFPRSWGQHWPFCFWMLVVIDHYSRKATMLRCFRGRPTSAEVTDALDLAIAMVGSAPKYIVSDQGAQFREDYKDWCELRGIKPRFGAIGQHGSIAICERFIRNIKQECVRRIIIPLATDAFERELLTYALWYNEHRTHQALQGRTPNEVHEGRFPACDMPRIEVIRMPKGNKNPDTAVIERIAEKAPRLRLVVKHFDNRRHLPIVELERAA